MKLIDTLRAIYRGLWPTPRSRWLFALNIPWTVPFASYLMIGKPYLQSAFNFIGGTLFVGLLLTLGFVLLNWLADQITQRYPGIRQTAYRMVLTMLGFIGVAAVILPIYVWLFTYFGLFDSQLQYTALSNSFFNAPNFSTLTHELTGVSIPSGFLFGLDLVVILFFVFFYEVFYSLENWQKNQLGKEFLKKAGLQGQLQGLRNQISPHFLFNSLNSLSSLVTEDPQRAERFVDEMANVYRYLLQAGSSRELTPLSVELAFIQSYYHLLKTRYGPGLTMNIRVDEHVLNQQLPPLTLQMLVENAVKHNIILADRPLSIEISSTPAGQLSIRNNLQRKEGRRGRVNPESTRVGLSNITARYQLLAQTGPQISTGPDYFTVLLPLLPDPVHQL